MPHGMGAEDYIRNSLFNSRYIEPVLRGVLKSCRDIETLREAKELIPIAELVQDNVEILEDELNYQDNLLPLIVDWFSTKFFSWFQPPNCEKCNEKLEYIGNAARADGIRSEEYECRGGGDCQYKYQFVRHNDPAILLRTRQGRCGEFGNCFMTVLRALDYQTRVVHDSTDHVWNEVWSFSKKRWLHVDPCEGVIDTPLLYEVGWSKKLEYCLAFGQYEVIDVTSRYTVDFEASKSRRNLCNEQWLSAHLDELTENLLASAPSNELKIAVRERRNSDKELMYSLALKPQIVPSKDHFRGRKTGSIEWRIQRSEYSPIEANLFVIKVTGLNAESELYTPPPSSPGSSSFSGPLFSLTYNCDRDLYTSTSSSYGRKGWSSLAYRSENLDFKYERDWKTSYVARYETCPASKAGCISWRFDMTNLGQNWERVEILVSGKEYPNTSISLELKKSAIANFTEYQGGSEETAKRLTLNEINTLSRQELQSFGGIVDLTATLSGGDELDEVAWQKPQLFRQTRGKNSKESALSWCIY